MLITTEELKANTLIPTTVSEERLKMHIFKAELMDLKPFLGNAMYGKVVSEIDAYNTSLRSNPNFTPTSSQEPYLDLLNGKTYTSPSGNEIVFVGLRIAICYLAYARYVKWDKYRATPTGVVVKRHDNSTPVDNASEADNVSQARSEANAVLSDVVTFLRDNKEDYPLFRYSRTNRYMRQSGPRVTAIDIYTNRTRIQNINLRDLL